MKHRFQFLIVCLAAAFLPLVPAGFVAADQGPGRFPGWVDRWDGVPLKRLPFTWRERRLAEGFPGPAALFTDGSRQLVLRYAEQPTRRMRPAFDCFRQAGFTVSRLPGYTDSRQRVWSAFRAVKAGETWRVSERVSDLTGRQWNDASDWYLPAAFARTAGPWWDVVVMEKSPGP